MDQTHPKPLHIATETHPEGYAVVRVRGEVDIKSSITLRDTLKRLVKQNDRGLIIALAEVSYMDSSGVAVLIEGYKWCQARGIPYCLIEVSRPVMRVIELAFLTSVLTIAENLDEAISAFVRT